MRSPDRGVATIFVLPWTLVVVGALLFVAVLYGRRDLATLTSLILVFGVGVRLWAGVSLAGLACRSTVDKERILAGEKLTLRVSVRNDKLLPIWLRLRVPVCLPRHSPAEETALTKEGSLRWYRKADFEWELSPDRRGAHRIGPPRLFAGDLFDFLCREYEPEGSHEVLVYPRCAALRPFSFPRRDFFGVPGPLSPVHDPLFILGTRDYQGGQPAKHIHWKASARHCRLQEKVFESTRHEKVLLAIDAASFETQGAEEDFERVIEVAAGLAAAMDRAGHCVGVISNGVSAGGETSFVPVRRSYGQLSAIMEVLARLLMTAREDILEVLNRSGALGAGTSCVYLSYGHGDATAAVSEHLRRRKTPATCFVTRPLLDRDAQGVHLVEHLRSDAGTP